MQSDKKARHGAPKSSGNKKKKFNRKGVRHHQRTTDQSRRRSVPHISTRSNQASNGRRKAPKGIDPTLFVSHAVEVKNEEAFVPKNAFDDFGFSDTINKNLRKRNYKLPTPIQDGAIESIMNGRDLIGLANTGTGKTAAFVLPLVSRFEKENLNSRILVLTPTRELASQIEDEFRSFTEGLQIRSALIIGGVSMHKQINALARKPKVLIATPGRMLDMLNQKKISLSNVSFLVLDEVDRMLDMGFIKDIEKLIDLLPSKRQTLCFSATITPDIQKLLDELLNNPVMVSVRKGETAEHIEQEVMVAETTNEKIDTLTQLLREEHYTKVLIFGRTKHGVQKLSKKLIQAGITAEAIHGNKSQPQRQRALDAFKKGRVTALVATDVAARGLDIDDVSHVINFDQPMVYEDYIHRIGRTARAGKKGHAITFISEIQERKINRNKKQHPFGKLRTS